MRNGGVLRIEQPALPYDLSLVAACRFPVGHNPLATIFLRADLNVGEVRLVGLVGSNSLSPPKAEFDQLAQWIDEEALRSSKGVGG